MRRAFVAVALASAVLAAQPAQAGVRTIQQRSVIFKAATPCAVTCSYWLGPDGPVFTVTAIANAILGDERDVDKLTSYSCTKPGPKGSYRDLVLTAPAGANFLKVIGYPKVDWDIVLCAKPATGNNGKMIAFETQDGIDFDAPDRSCWVGCRDTILTPVVAGRKYVLRAYSWADPADLPVRIYFQQRY